MKKAVKVIGKMLKWYVVLDVLLWVFIGIAQYLKILTDRPQTRIIDADVEALANAVFEWKRFLNK